ncbi:hypothetical protein HMPREF9630_00864 [Peptoanaerobacter stomatis]|uniref:Putative gluconeogenesis factor n=1 Tax=Peptoanaerobacter stomatis TaxID=796937 RepID=V9HN92_9FIRM|nr:gluconeogenesis factor YvcK family protein [Peptoanaerobacter stomatis]EHL14821.1 hypothetical protein HMPREF9630_00864 [Peptoanaerobacter stomatis]
MKNKATITLLGGGTGQSNILRGLKKFDVNLNSIVTMADDGGSSGILRQEMDILPPGDLRNCILALSNIEPEMEKLFQYRFSKGSLKGQNFGNLFIAAMNEIHGDLRNAIAQTSKILAVRGNVYPVTYDNINLLAKLQNGNIVRGESIVAKECINQKSAIDKIYIEPDNVSASEDAINAIRKSDVIIAGPGSLYTSIFPVLLIKEIAYEIKKSNAVKIFITNIMTEHGETDRFTSKDFALEIVKNFNDHIFNYFIVNNGKIPNDIMLKYNKKDQNIIKFEDDDANIFKKMGITVIHEDMVKIKNRLIFHDNEKVAQIINEIFKDRYNINLEIFL